MGRYSNRTMGNMFSGAIAAQEGETVAQLKEEIELLKTQSVRALELSVEDIIPLQLPGQLRQPRLYFDPQKMERLKDSISKHGVLEPILVRPGADNKLEIISGERRWRCCRELEKLTIPGIVREMSDSIALEAALIAHLLNEEITSIEQTDSILSLLSLRLDVPVADVKTGLYQVKNSRVRGTENSRIFSEDDLNLISEILGEFDMKLNSFVSNRLPMLNLPSVILDAVREGRLSPTNAVILNRQAPEVQENLLERVEGITKQELIELIKEEKLQQPVQEINQTVPIPVADRVWDRLKAIRKKKALLNSAKVQQKLSKIEQLLVDIESLEG